MLRVLLSSLLLVAGITAQTTYWVDALGGGNFTDLPAALAVARHGDVIRVRPGTYTPGRTDQGVRIVGESSAMFGDGLFEVHDLPAGRTFALVGIRAVAPYVQLHVRVARCHGAVELRNLQMGSTLFSNSRGAAIDIYGSLDVTVSDSSCRGDPGLRANNSYVTILQSFFGGTWGASGNDGMEIYGGMVHTMSSTFGGGGGSCPRGVGGNGVFVANDAALYVGAGCRFFAGTGCSWNGYDGSNMAGTPPYTALVRVDPGATNGGANYPTLHVASVPSVSVPSVPSGGTLAPTWSGGLSEPCVLLASLSSGRVLPTNWGPLAIDPQTAVLLYAGPAVAAPRGLALDPRLPVGTTLVVQGLASLSAGRELLLTNPVLMTLR